jgi:hypothetical protein
MKPETIDTTESGLPLAATPLFAPVEVVPAQIARMAKLIEKQARGECVIIGGGMRYGKTMALQMAMARDATPKTVIIADQLPRLGSGANVKDQPTSGA